ncbi:MAG TPA: MCE family protein [Mycobacteriales bacterium]|nr:MCE family protein [Mycobacteriales bacterium]
MSPVVTRRVGALTAAVVLLLAVAGAVVVSRGSERTVRITAHFTRAVGLYPGSTVRVLGVEVGTITDVEPEGDTVRVEMEVPASRRIPADARALVVPPSLVSDRYVQLAPAYSSGPVMADGADIPVERTGTPVELDAVLSSLNDLTVALGPEGANRAGALGRLVSTGAKNLGGNGTALHDALQDLSHAVGTLSGGREDLVAVLTQLGDFTATLAESDATVRDFNSSLATVSEQLAGERDELGDALRNLAVALAQVQTFVRDNRGALVEGVDGLADVTGVLVRQKDSLTEFLDVAPLALQNLVNTFNAKSGTLDARNDFQQEEDPTLFICELLEGLGQDCPLMPAGSAPIVPTAAAAVADPRATPARDLTLAGILLPRSSR